MRAKFDEEENNLDEDLRTATDRFVVLIAFKCPMSVVHQNRMARMKLGRNLAEIGSQA